MRGRKKMSITKYKLDYEVINHLKELNNMTFEESKQFEVCEDDYKHFMSMQLLECDLQFLKMAESLFKSSDFTLYELRRELVVLWEWGINNKIIDETKEDRIRFVADMENAIDRLILSKCFQEVE